MQSCKVCVSLFLSVTRTHMRRGMLENFMLTYLGLVMKIVIFGKWVRTKTFQHLPHSFVHSYTYIYHFILFIYTKELHNCNFLQLCSFVTICPILKGLMRILNISNCNEYPFCFVFRFNFHICIIFWF